ncbi:hypothetical protein BGZ54_002246, partial [Gamsiella multidivaricata]
MSERYESTAFNRTLDCRELPPSWAPTGGVATPSDRTSSAFAVAAASANTTATPTRPDVFTSRFQSPLPSMSTHRSTDINSCRGFDTSMTGRRLSTLHQQLQRSATPNSGYSIPDASEPGVFISSDAPAGYQQRAGQRRMSSPFNPDIKFDVKNPGSSGVNASTSLSSSSPYHTEPREGPTMPLPRLGLHSNHSNHSHALTPHGTGSGGLLTNTPVSSMRLQPFSTSASAPAQTTRGGRVFLYQTNQTEAVETETDPDAH